MRTRIVCIVLLSAMVGVSGTAAARVSRRHAPAPDVSRGSAAGVSGPLAVGVSRSTGPAPRTAAPSTEARPKFYDDDPLWVEPVTQDVTHASEYEPDVAYFYFVNYLQHPEDSLGIPRAKNVNTVDEVSDGPFFVNRAGRIPLTPALVVKAANTGDGPAQPLTVLSGRTDGIVAELWTRDANGVKWYLKLDPRGWPGMATGTEIIGAKLFWTLGYYTSEYHIVRFLSADLRIADKATIEPSKQAKRPMDRDDLDWLLGHSDRGPDGTYRAVASKAIAGKYVGRIRYEGTRADDPNDLIPHEDHRELRGLFVFSAWLDHIDIKRQQSIVTVITEGERSFIRRYVLDWGSILGSSGIGPRQYWEGFEQSVEQPGMVGKRIAAFGFIIPSWRIMPFYEAPAAGRLPVDESTWDPDRWWPLVTNQAFCRARADDKFWAAYKMTFITEDIVRAVVAEAQLGDPVAAEHVIKMIMDRRARIFSRYLTAINPIVEPVLDKDGRLRFRNAAVSFAGAARPSGYRAAWYTFDNETGATAPLGETEASDTVVLAPKLCATPRGATSGLTPPGATSAMTPGGTSYLKVELRCVGAPVASWEKPLTLYFRERAGGWELIGLERLPDILVR
jgi:hypothetical protein